MKTFKARQSDETFNILLKVQGISWSTEEEFQERLRESLTGKQVLEIGCYTGELFPHFQKYGAEIEGVDCDLEAVSRAQELGRRVHYGDIDGPNGETGQFKGRLSENPEVYDLIFSHDVFTPSATSLDSTIRSLVEVPALYLKTQACLIHIADSKKRVHKYSGLEPANLLSLGTFSTKTKEAIAWRKR